MRSAREIVNTSRIVALLASFSYGATISGTVKGPDCAPFKGAIVEPENSETKIRSMSLWTAVGIRKQTVCCQAGIVSGRGR
jgi:hypothetical protein